MKGFSLLITGVLLGGLLLLSAGCAGTGAGGYYGYPYDRYDRYYYDRFDRYPFGPDYWWPYRSFPHRDYPPRFIPRYRYEQDRFRYRRGDHLFGRPRHPLDRKHYRPRPGRPRW